MEPTLLNIHHGFNFRDLGGYQTKSGQTIKRHRLIRSGKLDLLSDRDVQFLSDYGVRYDVDFRSPDEQHEAPDRVPTGASYHFLPIFPYDETQVSRSWEERQQDFAADPLSGYKNMVHTYADIVLLPTAQKSYRKFFDLLLSNNGNHSALLFHCSAGKDRTGMGAVYLLSALGVDKDIIRNDYLTTNNYIKTPLAEVMASIPASNASENIESSVHDLWTVKADYLDSALATINKHYGSMTNYLSEALDLTDAQVADLKRLYLA
ncbi:tyrosine-protein phosphatase [Lacticaseibacillus hulanensis]|uniref:tyrosine-protein phosphatase n=1 Tax=Lacticaseibacillus hulanensis TaxID=2493111 RepID=UPI000FDC229D|nr:tyrosine-protein phosphatase [Lacticaseibacillus hulanensis]